MSEECVFVEYLMSNAVSGEENLLRGLFTYFLNTGVFDKRIRAAKLEPKSKRDDHIGRAFIVLYLDEINREFVGWVGSEDLAGFLFTDSVKSAFNHILKKRIDRYDNYHPFDTILGIRIKEVTGLSRKSLPKDLKKSFYTKVYNRLVKFIAESQDPKNANNMRFGEEEEDPDADEDADPIPEPLRDVEWWLRYALSKTGRESWIWSENLRAIGNLYDKMHQHENLDEVVKELLEQATVAGVMLS
jgi:hypothetical protein